MGINIQRYIWDDNKIEKLHPLSCITTDNIKKGEIEDISLPFTPWDSFSVWASLEKYNKSLYKNLDPEKIFADKQRLTLDDSKLFEEKIKEGLVTLDEKQLDEIIQSHYISVYE